MIMLIARKSLNALQRRESLLHSFNRLCGRLSRLAQTDMHAVLAVCSLQTQGGSPHIACVGSSNTDFGPPSAALRPQTVQIQAHFLHICGYGVCDLLRPAHLQWYPKSG